MKKLIALIVFISLLGCASLQPTIVITASGDITIKGYQAVALSPEKKTFAYKPWYTLGFLDSVIKALGSVFGFGSMKADNGEPNTKVARKQKFGFPYDIK